MIAQLAELRRQYPQLRSRRWVDGRDANGFFGVLWLTPQAAEMNEQDWSFPNGRFLSYVLGPTEAGGVPLYVVLNGATHPVEFMLPKVQTFRHWHCVFATAPLGDTRSLPAETRCDARAQSVLVFAAAP